MCLTILWDWRLKVQAQYKHTIFISFHKICQTGDVIGYLLLSS